MYGGTSGFMHLPSLEVDIGEVNIRQVLVNSFLSNPFMFHDK